MRWKYNENQKLTEKNEENIHDQIDEFRNTSIRLIWNGMRDIKIIKLLSYVHRTQIMICLLASQQTDKVEGTTWTKTEESDL